VLLAAAWWALRPEPPAPSDPVVTTMTTSSAVPTTTVAPEPEPIVVPAPPFEEYRAPGVPATATSRTRLVAVGTRRRDVLESDEAWLARHGLEIAGPAEPAAEALVPAEVQGMALSRLLRSPSGLVAIYGGRFLRVSDAEGVITLDAFALLHSPHDRANYMRDVFADANYADMIAQKVGWAARVGSTLYFDNHHETYAADSGGRTAFLSAFDLEQRALVWRTRPLVSRGRNFLVLGDVLVTAYGMTREPDFVHVVDAATGRVVQSLPIPSAPSWLATKGDRVHVACYDGEAEFRVTR
jgi:hypothetical protein